MKTKELLTEYWHFSPLIIFIVILLLVFQITANKKASTGKHLLFSFGILLIILVTASPLAFIGRNYLFSIHMINHIILLLIVPPLLLTGLNADLILKIKNSHFRKTGNVLFSAPLAWFLGMSAMYFWHIPAVFDAMIKSSFIHGLHIVSLLVLGIIFIWPVYAPASWKRLGPLQSALYLFIACVGCTVLGILITFSPPTLYVSYLPGDNPAFWDLIRSSWGIRPSIDQQAGGLIMWVPACIIYITNIMLILAGFYNQPDDEE